MWGFPDGRPAGIEEARAAEGKRKAQKVENPAILEKVPAERMTFTELAEWYLDLSPVKKLSSYIRIKQGIANFNQVFGNRIVSSLKAPGPGRLPGEAGRGRPGPGHHRHGNLPG